jgi:hypothetical protein
VSSWSFLTNHVRALLRIARHRALSCATSRPAWASPMRSACGIVTGLATASDVIKQKDGRRSRYRIQAHLTNWRALAASLVH